MTERACFPEPPCDWLTVTASPAFAFQCFANAWLNSWYSSRVGSYETLSSVTSAPAARAGATPGEAAASSSSAARIPSVPMALMSIPLERDLEAIEEHHLVRPIGSPCGAPLESSLH